MATRDRYVRILVGFAERLREAGLSLEAIGLVFLIYTLSLKRSIPGCLRIGVGGLAEALGFTVAKTERLLKEHERQGAVRVESKGAPHLHRWRRRGRRPTHEADSGGVLPGLARAA